MSTTGQTREEVVEYGRLLAKALAVNREGMLVGAYLHGSAAMGGWLADRSDVDLLLVVQEDTPAEAVQAIEQTLADNVSACPGTGLECSVVLAQQAATPTPPWPFLLHVQSGLGEATRRFRGDAVEGDADLLMHYAVCRATGVPLLGPDPAEVIGVVPRDTILAYLVDELGWGVANGSEAYAVLNACRALVYAADGELVSKLAGGRHGLDQGLGPAGVVARALDAQLGKIPPGEITASGAEFVERVANCLRLQLAAGGAAPRSA
jgi:streptomycin 3"-adenylyltransferase